MQIASKVKIKVIHEFKIEVGNIVDFTAYFGSFSLTFSACAMFINNPILLIQ